MVGMVKQFKKDKMFPNEAFIQVALEKYFLKLGYEIKSDGQVDILAFKENEKWIVEAKGLTSAVGLDFNTCIGQIVKSMDCETTNYAIAIPEHAKYIIQCSKIPSAFRERNNLYFLFVDEKENIRVVEPKASILL